MVILVVLCRVRPGLAGQFAVEASEFAAQVRANEPGCLGFQVSRSTEEEDLFLIYEQYCDAQALEAHRQTAYFTNFSGERLPALLLERQRHLYNWVAG